MSEAEKPAPTETPPANAEFTNLKSEMNRKLGNLEETNKALMAQLRALAKPAQASAAPKKVSVFENEDEFAEDVVTRAEARIQAKMDTANAKQAKIQTAVQAVYQDFPEIGDASSELHIKTMELLNSYPDDERQSASALKAAAHQAAAELDIKPKRKRAAAPADDFALGGSNGQASRATKKEALSADHIEVAKLFGVNVKDPAVKKRLEKRAERSEWSRWAKPDSTEE